MIYPPGTILQRMYFKERLKKITTGKFIEVGVGSGCLSNLLLTKNWEGIGVDLSNEALKSAYFLNRKYITSQQYKISNEDWITVDLKEKVDLIISSMVLEHLKMEDVIKYFDQCKVHLKNTGKAALFVPAAPAYWGIEDEIAGHYRRYTFKTVQQLMDELGWSVVHMTGLTYPISNLLFPLSEFLVKRSEVKKLKLSLHERTINSGNRKVSFKTNFPGCLKILLNEITMYPLHMLQKINSLNPKSLVIYFEAKPKY